MTKPDTIYGYDDNQTLSCERLLVTLLRGLGPWKDSIFLVGGLTPKYLIKAKPPDVPQHAGTQDVDIVIDLQILTDTEAYHTLEENLKKMKFIRAKNVEGKETKWRWQTKAEDGKTLILEFLADSPEIKGGKVQALPTERGISALNIPHSSMVFDLHDEVEIEAELLHSDGMAKEKVRFANLVSFTCLKAFAYDHRHERKDAHDLVYCLENFPGGIEEAGKQFEEALESKHDKTVKSALNILRNRFVSEGDAEGYLKDGPVSVAKFELGEGTEPEEKEERRLRQSIVSSLIEDLIKTLKL